jgi:uncharacterized protein (DUF1501 family)
MPVTCCAEQQRMTDLTRRGVLGRAVAAGAAGALAGLAGEGLETRLAFADAGSGAGGDVLVVVSLRGGFDGLSAIAPIGDPAYYAARPGIALPKSQAIAADGGMFGLHPGLAPLLPYWQAGRLAAVHAVGQENPTRSHFAAMEQMERAAAGTSLRTGWLDRLLAATGADQPLSGASIGSAMPGRLLAGPAPDVALASVDAFTLAGESTRRPMAAALRRLYDGAPEALAGVARAADAALGQTAAVRAAGYSPANGAVYPATPLGAALKDVARLIKGGVGLRAAAVDSGDWDMHEGLGTAVQGQRMFDNLTATATALAAFAADLGPDGMTDVTVVTVSEFGRRVAENGSKGVDHGHGNAMLVLGGGLRGGRVYGAWPGLAADRLVAGDLAVTTDYRAVIGEVLQQRCGVGDLSAVFPGVTPTRFGLAVAR